MSFKISDQLEEIIKMKFAQYWELERYSAQMEGINPDVAFQLFREGYIKSFEDIISELKVNNIDLGIIKFHYNKRG